MLRLSSGDNTKMVLTIAIPTYKRARYLKQAIDSAVNQKNRSSDYDIIVVNNDPEANISDLEEIYKDSPVKITFYKNSRNLGMLGNVNRCVELASGKYIAFLHDDDLLMPDYIENIMPILKAGDEPACLIPVRYILFERGSKDNKHKLEIKRKIKASLKHLFISRLLNRRKITEISVEDNVLACQNCYGAPSCGTVFSISKIKKHGLFFPEGTYSWDFISFRELNAKEKIYIFHRPLGVYRMTSGVSKKPVVQYQSYADFEDFIANYNKHDKAASFIEKYINEIRYINFCSLSPEAVEILDKNNNTIKKIYPSSKFKYYLFMIKRLRYWSSKRLDVEVPITNKAKDILVKSGIIGEDE